MIDLRLLRRALLVGLVFDLVLVGAAHLRPGFLPLLLFGAMLIAGVAGLLYARDLALGFGAAALGGAVVGAACGTIAVLAASLLGERPDLYLPYGVMVCTLTGVVGGVFGQIDVLIQRMIRRLK